MKKPVDPAYENRRLAELENLQILDTAPEPVFDDLCALARELCGTSMATITFIDRDRRWHKARVGVEVREGSRVDAFCDVVVEERELLYVPDLSADERFCANPLVATADGFRLYAGAPLALASGEVVGTLCVLDRAPRALEDAQLRALRTLARAVMSQIELRAAARRADERERLANEALLRQVSESTARRTFFGHLCHDLKAPVMSLLDALAGVNDAALAVDDGARIARARTDGRGLSDQVTKILDLMAVENRRLVPERSEFDLVATLARVVAPFRAVARGKGLLIDLKTDGEDWVLGDPARLTQVLTDLIDNAVKFTERGVIMVTRRREGDDVVFVVSDTGPGLAPELRDRIFDASARVEDTVARRFGGGGGGLGLPITKEITEFLGGTITCQSKPGVGTTFTVRLPLAAARLVATPVSGLKVLVVDDVTINQKVIRAILGAHKAVVVSANSGEEALEIFARETFDIVLMDRYMPGMGGVETVRLMREHEAKGGLTRTPIFGTSAASEASERQAFILAGADETIAKPMRLEEFWSKINRVRAQALARVA